MPGMTLYPILFTAAAVAFLLAAEGRRKPNRPARPIWVFKPLASAGFLLTAWLGGATHSAFGLITLTALAFSAAGDVLLIPDDNKRATMGGMAAFAIGHVCYIAAFLYRGVALWAAVPATVVMLVVGAVAYFQLKSHTQGTMRYMVLVYIVICSLMAVAAAGTSGATHTALFASAAVFFVASDIVTAQQIFVRRRFLNRLIALPMYYTAQLLFAVGSGS